MLPLAAMERLMKKAGAERVSQSAKAALKQILEDHAINLSQKALEIAKNSKRKTIKGPDVEIAGK